MAGVSIMGGLQQFCEIHQREASVDVGKRDDTIYDPAATLAGEINTDR
jgi:hypothetical protein